MRKILKTYKLIEKQVKGFNLPWVTKVALRHDPFRVLISCILSLRTKDKTTAEASRRLFSVAGTPYKIAKLKPLSIEKLIYPAGFYRNKAKVILNISKTIIHDHGGRLPGNLDDLLELKGVGRKTANLVLGLGFGIPAICVDTHVHRISNRLGWVSTRKPEETELALEKIFPKKYWIELNNVLVSFGQNLCVPVSPFCSKCHVYKQCLRKGVTRYR